MLANCQLLDASQLIDQVITPRIPGQVCVGLNEPQFVPLARQFSAALTLAGDHQGQARDRRQARQRRA